MNSPQALLGKVSQPPSSESLKAQAGKEDKREQRGEGKAALNLTHSPENREFWVRADPFQTGAGHVVSAIPTSAEPTPRGLRQHRAAQRQASNQASDEQGALGELTAMEVPEYLGQCEKRAREGRVASDGDR